MAGSRYQQGAIKRYYENRDTMSIQTLGELVSELFLCEDPTKTARLWERVAKALAHTDVQKKDAQKVVADRDVASLGRLVNQLTLPGSSGPSPSAPTPTPVVSPPKAPVAPTPSAAATPPVDPLDREVLKKALKAFRKRLKLTRLDEESKLGVGPLTGGAQSGVVAITPPNQYPVAVWEELVKQGKLKRSGSGFYGLVEG